MSLVRVDCKADKNKLSIHTIKQKEDEIYGSVSVTPATAKMVSQFCDKVNAKNEAALSVWLEDRSQKHTEKRQNYI